MKDKEVNSTYSRFITSVCEAALNLPNALRCILDKAEKYTAICLRKQICLRSRSACGAWGQVSGPLQGEAGQHSRPQQGGVPEAWTGHCSISRTLPAVGVARVLQMHILEARAKSGLASPFGTWLPMHPRLGQAVPDLESVWTETTGKLERKEVRSRAVKAASFLSSVIAKPERIVKASHGAKTYFTLQAGISTGCERSRKIKRILLLPERQREAPLQNHPWNKPQNELNQLLYKPLLPPPQHTLRVKWQIISFLKLTRMCAPPLCYISSTP